MSGDAYLSSLSGPTMINGNLKRPPPSKDDAGRNRNGSGGGSAGGIDPGHGEGCDDNDILCGQCWSPRKCHQLMTQCHQLMTFSLK